MNSALSTNRHPCFNAGVKGDCGRVHLPVAPKCNIKCNYCNRKYDCVNESRPGVSSALLTPYQALRYMEQILEKEPRITVAGIAGPGDPFANVEETLETIRLVKEKFPHLLLCLASNGLGLPDCVDRLADLGVTHVTVTINAVDPKVGKDIYGWVRDGKIIYRGIEAAELLLDRQLEAVRRLKEKGLLIKVNTIVVPGVNDEHVVDVARKMGEMGVDLHNCMPVFPNKDTPFEHVEEPTPEMMASLRDRTGELLPQMRHCTRCRADAVGLLGEDRSSELGGCLSACSTLVPSTEDRPRVAVATREGVLVNQHLGEARSFQIWERRDGEFQLVGEREAPPSGGGLERWRKLAEVLGDCRAVLVSGVGENPAKVLLEAGILPVEMDGFIEMGLQLIYEGGNLQSLKKRRAGGCAKGAGCTGDGSGC